MIISVIVPVYNVENYLRQCLDSIINQTYKDLEILLINDGSTDNSGAICDEYAEQDSRIKVVHKLNGGLSSARNSGLAIATGDYISFIDSDDYIEPSLYEYCMNELSQDTGLELIRYNFTSFSEQEQIPNIESTIRKPICLDDIFRATNKLKPIVWSSIYKTKMIRDLNLSFTEGLIHEDDLFTAELYARHSNIKALFIPIIGYHYRVGQLNSIMQNKNGKKSLSSLCTGFSLLLNKLKGSNIETIKRINSYALEFIEGAYLQSLREGESEENLSQILNPFLSISREHPFLSFGIEHKLLTLLFRWNPKAFVVFGKIYQPISRRLGSKRYK